MLSTLKNHATRFLKGFLALAVGILVADVLLGVGSRYLWGEQIKWTEELAILLLVWVSFLGIAAAFESKSHLGIDLVVRLFDPQTAGAVRIFTHLVTLGFIIAVFGVGGIRMVLRSIQNWNVLPALQVPDVVQYLPLPISGAFIVLFEICALREKDVEAAK